MLVRRPGRLLVELAAANAGLRSRECVTGRLKWGRAAVDFPLEAGLRAAELRVGWGSAELRSSIGAGEAGEADFGGSNSGASSSWSRERRKYAEDSMDELA